MVDFERIGAAPFEAFAKTFLALSQQGAQQQNRLAEIALQSQLLEARETRLARLKAELEPKVPTTRRFLEGGEEVDRQWNPRTGRWERLSGGPRFQEKSLEQIREEAAAKREPLLEAGMRARLMRETPKEAAAKAKAVEAVKKPRTQVVEEFDEEGRVQKVLIDLDTGERKAVVTGKGFKAQVQPTEVPGREEFRDLRNAEISAKQSINIGLRLIRQVGDDPTILNFTGFVARGLDSLKNQAVGLARLSGIDIQASTQASDYKGVLDRISTPAFVKTAEESARFKSAIFALAWAKMASRGQRGQSVSNRDIAMTIEEIGGQTGSPAQFRATMKDVLFRLDEGYRLKKSVVEGKPFEQIPSLLPKGFAAEETRAPAAARPAAVPAKPSTRSGFKGPEEVRAAFEDGLIGEQEAIGLLRQFGKR